MHGKTIQQLINSYLTDQLPNNVILHFPIVIHHKFIMLLQIRSYKIKI